MLARRQQNPTFMAFDNSMSILFPTALSMHNIPWGTHCLFLPLKKGHCPGGFAPFPRAAVLMTTATFGGHHKQLLATAPSSRVGRTTSSNSCNSGTHTHKNITATDTKLSLGLIFTWLHCRLPAHTATSTEHLGLSFMTREDLNMRNFRLFNKAN